MTILPPRRTLAAFVTLGVLACVVASFILAGPPSQERLRRIDEQRVNDLLNLRNTIDSYWSRHTRLPTSVSEALGADAVTTISLPLWAYDPITHMPYEYQPSFATSTSSTQTSSSYQLCATFDTNKRLAEEAFQNPENIGASFFHPAGYFCFPLIANTVGIFPPTIQ